MAIKSFLASYLLPEDLDYRLMIMSRLIADDPALGCTYKSCETLMFVSKKDAKLYCDIVLVNNLNLGMHLYSHIRYQFWYYILIPSTDMIPQIPATDPLFPSFVR